MKAMIFAAGLGTRLRPLTNNKPKALVEVNGISLLEIVIRRLKFFGVTDIIVNVHHFAEQIEQFLKTHHNFGIRIEISDEQEMLLDTGGGLKKAAWFFDDEKPFIVCNTDILTNLDIKKMYEKHLTSGALATLAIQNRITSRYLLFDNSMQLCGWENKKSGEKKLCRTTAEKLTEYSFSGVHIIDPSLLKMLPDEPKVSSIIDNYLSIARTQRIIGYEHNDDFWLDVGKPETLSKAAAYIDILL